MLFKAFILCLLSTIQVEGDVSDILKIGWSNSNSYQNQYTSPAPNWHPITSPPFASSQSYPYNAPNRPPNFYLPIPQLPNYLPTTTAAPPTTTAATTTTTPTPTTTSTPCSHETRPWSQQGNGWVQQPNSWPHQPSTVTQQPLSWPQVLNLQQPGPEPQSGNWLQQSNGWSQLPVQQTTWPKSAGIGVQQPTSWSQFPGPQQPGPWSQQSGSPQQLWHTNNEIQKPGSTITWQQSNFQPISSWMQADAINQGRENKNQQSSTSKTNPFLESTVALPPVPQPVVDLSFLANVTPMTEARFLNQFKNESKPILPEPLPFMMPPPMDSKPNILPGEQLQSAVPLRMLVPNNKPQYLNQGVAPQISTSVSTIFPSNSGNQVMTNQLPIVPEIRVWPMQSNSRPPSNQYLPQQPSRPQTINYHWATNNNGGQGEWNSQRANNQWPVLPSGNNQWNLPPVGGTTGSGFPGGIPMSNVEVKYWPNQGWK